MMHDGPIYHYYTLKENNSDNSNIQPSVKYALEVTRTATNGNAKNYKIPCDLTNQLKDDRSFQSFLNKQKMQKESVKIGLYRLLLELSISLNTISGLRKRIVSYLKKMDENQEVELEVLYSVIDIDEDDDNCKSKYWIDGLISLREYGMKYPKASYNGILSYLIHIGKSMLGKRNKNYCVGGDWSLDRAKDLATISKRIMDELLADDSSTLSVDDGLLYKLSDEVLEPLLIQTTTGESVNALGVTTAQILYYKIQKLNNIDEQQKFISEEVQQHWKIATKQDVDTNSTMNASTFAKLAWIKGLLVTIPQNLITMETNEQLKSFLIYHSRYANNNDSATRYSALKGLEMLLCNEHCDERFCQDVLEIIFHLWECPTKNRSITGLLPKLFHICIQIITASSDASLSTTDVIKNGILPRILSQPSYRKGRYQALEVLLPQIGAHVLLSNDQESCDFLYSLVKNLGLKENLPIANVMADLWKQILVRHREEEGYFIIPSVNEKKKKGKSSTDADKSSLEHSSLPKEWVGRYVIPPLKESIVSPVERIRSSTSSFCLPLLKEIAGNNLTECAQIFQILLESTIPNNSPSSNPTTIQLWAILEIIRHAKLQSIPLHTTHHTHLSAEIYQASLLHSSSSIRLVAFSIMDYYYNDIALQVSMWKYALPYALKSGDKSYVSKLVALVMALVIQLNTHLDEQDNEVSHPDQTLLCQFVCHFLVPKIIINHGSYPGTVYEKELFVLLLLKRLLEFFPTKTVKKKVKRVPPKVTQFRKECHDTIQTSLRGCSALRDSVLTTLLFSMWDKTRLGAYEIILLLDDGCKLLSSTLASIDTVITPTTNWRGVLCRGIYLSSSPRQREADTGAKMLAIYHKLLFLQNDYNFLEKDLLPLIQNRLNQIELTLGVITESNENTDSKLTSCSMPLAHGLIHGMQLIAGQQKHCPTINDDGVFDIMIDICCRSMEISLTVVADVDDDEYDEHSIDPKLKSDDGVTQKSQTEKKSSAVPLNVNTGAIGANAIFATLSPNSEEDRLNRATLQRIVVGSWLLIKEACAALSTILSNIPPSTLSSSIVSKCGSLLLSTLISLKHQGAAFAAHKTFQLLCSCCYPQKNEVENLKHFPMEWAINLLGEISSDGNDIVERKVRDSTLRRSTGYALGFLAIVRSEIFSSSASGLPKPIFHMVMAHLIRLSLPCHSDMKAKLKRLGNNQNSIEKTLVYRKYISSSLSIYVPDEEYEWKSRVHALNILRLAIMDAPLAKEIHTFAGDAVFSSLLGYNDFDSWAVRNSSTMVFSSVMLRVIDADKNAHTESITFSESTGSSAVTAKELFRKYPFLSPFLVSSLEQSDLCNEENTIDPSLVYAILLLLARLQPASSSSVDVGANDVIVPLIKPLLNCLGHSYHKVRIMASRALAALCTDEVNYVDDESLSSSRTTLLQYSLNILSCKEPRNWNHVHGALLSVQALIRPVISQSEEMLSLETWNDLMLNIHYYSSWCDWKYTCPPTCVAIALEIYFDCRKRCQNNNKSVDEMAFKIVSVVDKMENRGIEVIGLSYLGAVASKISCCCSFSDLRCIFNQTESSDVPGDSILNIQALFESSFFDVRVSSIKTFKKLLYVQLSQDEDNQPERSICILSQICHVLISSIRLELGKRGHDNYLSYHAPTLRRLSRCLIDCICYMQSIDFKLVDTHRRTFMTDAFDAVRNCWSLFVESKRIGGSTPEDDTTLGGNALELMAFSLSFHLVNSEKEPEDEILNMLEHFVHAIKQATDPNNEWKIRYSAALAIPSSGVLNLLRSHESVYQSNENVHTLCLDMYIELLKLLQDGDEDVREAAGKAVHKAINAAEQSECSHINSAVSIPLNALENAYADICTKVCFSDRMKFMKVLVDQLLFYCKSLNQDLKFTLEEISANEKALSCEGNMDENSQFYSAELMNLSTKRKVFEDENPNTFEEKLVIMQLNIATILHLHENHYKKDSIDESFEELLNECQNTLQFLVDVYCNGNVSNSQYNINQNVLLDLTRCQSIFPRIFAIILGSASAFIHSYREENSDQCSVPQINTNASTLIRYGVNFFHPHVVTALKVLVRATSPSSNDETSSMHDDILDSCFLLPTIAKK